MKFKRYISLLVVVVVTVIAMPITAFALTFEEHPVTVDWTNVKLYAITGTSFKLNDSDYDKVIVRITPMSRSGIVNYYRYTVYYAKTSQLSLNGDGTYQSYSQSVVHPVFRADSAIRPSSSENVTDGFELYPEYIGGVFYKDNNSLTLNKKTDSETEIVYTKDNFTSSVVDPPTDPQDPPKPDPPPMVIPPHNPWYVPWEFDRLVDFDTRVRGAIGAIVNVGLVYFGIILAVYIMIRIVKGFEDRTAGGGG